MYLSVRQLYFATIQSLHYGRTPPTDAIGPHKIGMYVYILTRKLYSLLAKDQQTERFTNQFSSILEISFDWDRI